MLLFWLLFWGSFNVSFVGITTTVWWESLLTAFGGGFFLAFWAYELICLDIWYCADINTNAFKVVPFIALITTYHLCTLISSSTYAIQLNRLLTSNLCHNRSCCLCNCDLWKHYCCLLSSGKCRSHKVGRNMVTFLFLLSSWFSNFCGLRLCTCVDSPWEVFRVFVGDGVLHDVVIIDEIVVVVS